MGGSRNTGHLPGMGPGIGGRVWGVGFAWLSGASLALLGFEIVVKALDLLHAVVTIRLIRNFGDCVVSQAGSGCYLRPMPGTGLKLLYHIVKHWFFLDDFAHGGLLR